MKKEYKTWVKPLIFLIISVTFIFIGIFRNEVTTVLNKAAAICMECIGLG